MKLIFSLIYAVNIICIILIIIKGKHPIDISLFWIFILLFIPIIGLILYYLFGIIPKFQSYEIEYDYNEKELIEKYKKLSSTAQDLIKLNHENGIALSVNNDINIFFQTVEFYNDLIENIKKANKSIYLSYYIIRNDIIGQKIIDELKKKAENNVDVQIVYDIIGSHEIKKAYWNDLALSGIKINSFTNTRFKFFNRTMNFRNHKKLLIIDRKIAYLGSANIGDEYFSDLYGDCNLKIEGDGLLDLNNIMEYDLAITNNYRFKQNTNYSSKHSNMQNENLLNIIHEIPGYNDRKIYNAYLKAIYGAKKSITLITPYLIPDLSFVNALNTAKKNGVDIKIIIPAISGKKVVHYASLYYASCFAKKNINVYKTKSFIHTKSLIIDEDICTVGSYNVDPRSYYFQLELCLFIYEKDAVLKLNDYSESLIADAIFMDKLYLIKKTTKQRILEKICRLFSPLL